MRHRVVREAVAVALLLGALLIAVALVSHSPLDPSPFHASTLRDTANNLAGWLGATLSAALFSFFGLTAFVLPVAAAVLGWRLLRQSPIANPRLAVAGWGLLLLALPGFASLLGTDMPYRDGRISSGGYVGLAETELLRGFAGPVGGIVVLVFLLILGVLLLSGASAGALADRLTERVRSSWFERRRKRSERRLAKEETRARKTVIDRQIRRIEGSDDYKGSLTVKQVEGRGRFRIVRKQAEDRMVEEPADEPKISGARTGPRGKAAKPAAAAKKAAAPRRKDIQEEFDFVAFTWHSGRTPVRRGWIHEWGFTAKGFTEQADYDILGDAGTNASVEEIYSALGDVVNAFQTVRAPHRADLHLLLGRRLRPSPLFLRSLDLSGSIGHSIFVDSERHRLQEKADDLAAALPDSLSDVTPLGETDFLFQNTVNQLRWGIYAAAAVVPAPRATGRAAIRYDRGLYYNGDPMQTSSSLDVRIDGAYTVRTDLSLELRYEIHRTRVGDAGSPQDFNRSEFALRCRYRFAGAIPLGGRGREIP